jgi:hypothetical protein
MTSKIDISKDDADRPSKFYWFQWLLTAMAILLLIGLKNDGPRVFMPGASMPLLGTAVTVAILAALLNAPPVFYRVPRLVRPAAWLLLVASIVLFLATIVNLQEAYQRTPKGADEAAMGEKIRLWDAEAAREKAKSDAEAAVQAAGDQQSAALMEKAEACLPRGKKSLAETVKANLQNPRSFEFVDITIATVTDDQAVVFMGFRGENGFGAIRTETIRAVMDTRDCSISDIGDPQTE